jgi:hypothetical protein
VAVAAEAEVVMAAVEIAVVVMAAAETVAVEAVDTIEIFNLHSFTTTIFGAFNNLKAFLFINFACEMKLNIRIIGYFCI